ncbi:hypothetical protein Tco_1124388 [Tanacetum coccineum]|uniref:Uncharacterized protein n=1 Tax=Tanacetum coccineum TaxID=301880 RepID=A0ABQ5J622_9ASTR
MAVLDSCPRLHGSVSGGTSEGMPSLWTLLKSDLSPRPSPTTIIPDSIPETSGGNLGGHSSSDKSLSGNEGDMTLQSVYDLCLSLCAQVSDQAKEILHLKAQIKKLKKQAKPVIKHHRAWMQSVSLKQRLARKRSSKKQRVHKESVSKQGRKFAKGESSVQGNPLFDEIPEDTVDHMETENAQDVGRTREIVDEEKEIDENILSTEDVLSTDKEKVSTDRPIVSTDGSKVSTDRQIEGTDEQIKGTEEQIESTDGQRKGTEDHTEEGSATQATQTPTSTIFGDDETIAKVLLNMSQAKAVSREKEKGELIPLKVNLSKVGIKKKPRRRNKGENISSKKRKLERFECCISTVMDRYQVEDTEGLIEFFGEMVHTLVTETGYIHSYALEKKYPLRKKVLVQMLKLKLESEEDSTMALELIRFIKKLLAELEPEE